MQTSNPQSRFTVLPDRGAGRKVLNVESSKCESLCGVFGSSSSSRSAWMPLSFIESPFTTKAEYEKWMQAGCPPIEGASLTTAMAGLDVSDSSSATPTQATSSAADPESWGNLEFTDARKAYVKAEFEKGATGGRMELKQVHSLLFNKVERGEYDFDNFDADVQATCPNCSTDMAWDDVQKFLDENL